jgi:serine phosphatase RsbU (regulator of sigma subunit)
VLCSAGHPPALIVDGEGQLREEPLTGPLLGAFASPTWPEETLSICDHELILLYTDGIPESAGRGERFGIDRLRALVAEHADATPAELLARIDATLDAFSTDAGRDDIAALALRRRVG